MKKVKYFCVLVSLIAISCLSSDKSSINSGDLSPNSSENFGIVIHGDAGTILKNQLSDSLELAYKTKLEEAIRAQKVMTESEHVFLFGQGAEVFAASQSNPF